MDDSDGATMKPRWRRHGAWTASALRHRSASPRMSVCRPWRTRSLPVCVPSVEDPV